MTASQEIMQHKTPKIVLLLIVLMAVFSPFMQLDSLDNFPVATGDIEMHLISVLFETGMFFVFAGILKLFPKLLCTNVRPPCMIFLASAVTQLHCSQASPVLPFLSAFDSFPFPKCVRSPEFPLPVNLETCFLAGAQIWGRAPDVALA